MKHHSTVIILGIPVLFFLIWLQPLFVIRWFLSSHFLVYVSKVLMILACACGVYGLWSFGLEVNKALTQRAYSQANLWLKVPLAIVVIIITIFFYLPLITA